MRRNAFWIRLGITLGVWAALAVALTGQAYLIIYTAIQAQPDLPKNRPPLALAEIFQTSLSECLIWASLTLGVFWLARRFPIARGRWPRNLAIHVGACLVCALVATVLSAAFAEIIRKEFPKPTMTVNVLVLFFVAKLNNNVFFYWAILALAHIVHFSRELRERELLSAQLEAKLAQTQLQILKMQLHPHFLFNTLNAISALIHQDVEMADRMIARLGDLLRSTLENANRQEVSVRQELDFIQPYLEIEKARLGTRLTVEFKIDPSVMDAQVPNLILQPLVENAIRHGIAGRPDPGRIQIQAGRDNGCLRLAVADSGPGMREPAENPKGIGLANTRARLEKLYGSQQRLEMISGPDGGLKVDITIPFRETGRDRIVDVA